MTHANPLALNATTCLPVDAERARETVQQKFNIVKQAAKVRDIYVTLLAGLMPGAQHRRGLRTEGAGQ